MACPKQLMVGLTIVASEQTTITTSSAVKCSVDREDLLTVNVSPDGLVCTLTPVGPLGTAVVKIGYNTLNVSIIAGSPASIKLSAGNPQ